MDNLLVDRDTGRSGKGSSAGHTVPFKERFRFMRQDYAFHCRIYLSSSYTWVHQRSRRLMSLPRDKPSFSHERNLYAGLLLPRDRDGHHVPRDCRYAPLQTSGELLPTLTARVLITQFSELAQGTGKDFFHRGPVSPSQFHAVGKHDCDQRVSPELENPIAGTDVVYLKQFAPKLSQDRFGFRVRHCR